MKRVLIVTLVIALVGITAFAVPAAADPGPPRVQIVPQADGSWVVNIAADTTVVVNVNGTIVTFPLAPAEASTPPPAQAPEPAPAAAPPTGDRLWGSCTSGGVQFDLRWYGGRDNVLQFSHETDDLRRLNQLHETNPVSCNLQAVPFPVRVEGAARTFDLIPGQGWGWEFEPGNFPVGFRAVRR